MQQPQPQAQQPQQQQASVAVAFLSPAQYGHLAPLLCVVRALLKSDPAWRPQLAIYTSHGSHARHRRIDSAVEGPHAAGSPADPELDGIATASFAWSAERHHTILPEPLARHEATLPPLARDFLSGARAMWLELSQMWRANPELTPQMIVADHCCLAAPYLAAAFDIPLTVLYSNCLPLPSWSPFEPDLYVEVSGERHRASWMAVATQAIRLAGRRLGLHPPGLLLRTYRHFGKTIGAPTACDPVQRGDLSLVNTTRLLFTQQKHAARNVHFVGPLVAAAGCSEAAPEVDAALADILRARPFVYVSFGTLFRPRPEQWKALLDALKPHCLLPEPAGAHIVVSAPKDDRAVLRALLDDVAPGRYYLHHWIPQNAVLHSPRLQLFISHAGNNSALEALVAGAPMMLFPFAVDQPFNAYALQRLGAATVSTFQDVTSEDVRLRGPSNAGRDAVVKQLASVYAGHEHTASARAAQLIKEEMFLRRTARKKEPSVRPQAVVCSRVSATALLCKLFLQWLFLVLSRR
jgi:UDP:flavonoid glycosyltransferase YjiC (YdhE family)